MAVAPASLSAVAETHRKRVAGVVTGQQQRVLDAVIERFAKRVSEAFLALERSAVHGPEIKALEYPLTYDEPAYNEFQHAMQRIVQQEYVNVAGLGLAASQVNLGTVAAFDLNDRLLRGVIGEKVKGITEETRKALDATIRQGIDDGVHPSVIAKRMREQLRGYAGLEDLTRSRSYTIARTETATAFNLGAVTGYQQSGLVRMVEVQDGPNCGWLAHNDPDRAQGKIVTLDEAMTHPIAHPNCLRAFAPVAAGLEPKGPRAQAPVRPQEPPRAPTALPPAPVVQIPTAADLDAAQSALIAADDELTAARLEYDTLQGTRHIPADMQAYQLRINAAEERMNAAAGRSAEAQAEIARLQQVVPKDIARREAEIARLNAQIRDIPDHEVGFAVDDWGNVVVNKTGTGAGRVGAQEVAGSVEFSPEELRRMRGSTLVHNHPGAFQQDLVHLTSFSPQDIGLFVNRGIREGRIVGKAGDYAFDAERLSSVDGRDVYEAMSRNYARLQREVRGEVSTEISALREAVLQGKITPIQFSELEDAVLKEASTYVTQRALQDAIDTVVGNAGRGIYESRIDAAARAILDEQRAERTRVLGRPAHDFSLSRLQQQLRSLEEAAARNRAAEAEAIRQREAAQQAAQQQASVGTDPTRTRLSTSQDVVRGKDLSTGINTTYLGQIDGIDVVIKPTEGTYGSKLRNGIPVHAESEREMAAQVINDALGRPVNMPNVVRRDVFGQDAIVVQFVPSSSGNALTAYAESQSDAMAFFDSVIGNTDRHIGNWLTTPKNDLVAIDHGLSFPSKLIDKGLPIHGNYGAMDVRHALARQELTGSESDALRRLLSQKAEVTKALKDVGLKGGEITDMFDRVRFMLDQNRTLSGSDFGTYGSGTPLWRNALLAP
jgi:hypothetical protein